MNPSTRESNPVFSDSCANSHLLGQGQIGNYGYSSIEMYKQNMWVNDTKAYNNKDTQQKQYTH